MFTKSCGRVMRILTATCETKATNLPLSITAKRSMSGECDREIYPPTCSPDNLRDKPCFKAQRKEKVTPTVEFKSMWDNPDCCKKPICADAMPRFDDLYYQQTDKAKRLYRQTWNECPDLKIRKKVICCYDQMRLPPLERRPRKCVPMVVCPRMDPVICRGKTDFRCPKTTMPCCPGARDPPKCKVVKIHSPCKKRCCPYPSFSECKHPRPLPLHPKECRCTLVESMCDVWAEWRRISKFKKLH